MEKDWEDCKKQYWEDYKKQYWEKVRDTRCPFCGLSLNWHTDDCVYNIKENGED